MAVQRTLSFAVPQAHTDLPEGFVDTLDFYMQMCHGEGICKIQDSTMGTGYLLRFIDRPDPEPIPGICYKLKNTFGNPKASEMIDANRWRKRNQNGGGASTRQKGNLVHRHVYHQVECMRTPTAICTCPFGKQTPDKPNEQAKQLLQTVKDFGWIPIHSEMAIVSMTMRLATRVDLLAYDPGSMTFILVSWKTGYKEVQTQISASRSQSSCLFMNSPLDKIPDNERERNQLQLLCEYMILTQEYQLEISRALVIYIHFDKTDANRKLVDAAAGWWWNQAEIQTQFWDAMRSKDGNHSR
jgi:hypothetical protein